MVFVVRQGEKNAVWVNTAFDPIGRRIQYVYVIPEVVVTVITLDLMPKGDCTAIRVVYERTALADAANELVKNMAAADRVAGKQWEQQINRHLSQ